MAIASLTRLVPDPFESDKEFRRFYHLDLEGLETEELVDELRYLQAHLWGSLRDSWPRERVMALEGELRQRGVRWV